MSLNLKKYIFYYFPKADSDVDVKPFSCTPSEWFQKDCNHCQCGDSGTWAQCDVDLCDPEDKTKKLQAPKDCKEKDRFFDGCNDCFCRGSKNKASQFRHQNV